MAATIIGSRGRLVEKPAAKVESPAPMRGISTTWAAHGSCIQSVTHMRVTILVLALTGCAPPPAAESGEGLDYNELNAAAGDLVLYELQARSANACHPDDGSPAQRAACAAKIAPTVRAQPSCAIDAELRRIALGTLDDLLDDTADPKQAITIRYLDERLG